MVAACSAITGSMPKITYGKCPLPWTVVSAASWVNACAGKFACGGIACVPRHPRRARTERCPFVPRTCWQDNAGTLYNKVVARGHVGRVVDAVLPGDRVAAGHGVCRGRGAGCRRAAARALYTHRNTVLNRLQRAERLLPFPLAGHGLEVGVALEIARWLGTQPGSAAHDG